MKVTQISLFLCAFLMQITACKQRQTSASVKSDSDLTACSPYGKTANDIFKASITAATEETDDNSSTKNATGQAFECFVASLNAGADANQIISTHNKDDATALAIASAASIKVVSALLQHGADANKAHQDWPPLFSAIWSGRDDIVALLISKGAKTNYVSKTREGVTAYHLLFSNDLIQGTQTNEMKNTGRYIIAMNTYPSFLKIFQLLYKSNPNGLTIKTARGTLPYSFFESALSAVDRFPTLMFKMSDITEEGKNAAKEMLAIFKKSGANLQQTYKTMAGRQVPGLSTTEYYSWLAATLQNVINTN